MTLRVPPAPDAARDDTVDVLHGVEVADPYRWLEDGDAPATQAWTEAQNARTRAVLDALPDRPRLHSRLTELLSAGAASAPRVGGQWAFSLDRWGDHDQAVLAVRPLDGDRRAVEGEPRVLIDPHAATGDATAAIDWFHPSPDGRLVAYGSSAGGDERSTLRVVDVATGRHLPDEITETRAASVAWWPDATGFAYARYPDDDEYHRHVALHRLGDDPGDDEVLFPPPDDPAAWPDVSLSRDGRWYLIHVSYGWSRVDVLLVDATTRAVTPIITGVDAISAFEVAGDRIVGHTTIDAPRGRVVTAPLTAPTPEHWTTLVPESEAVIDGVAVAGGALLVASTHAATGRLDHYPLGAGEPSAGTPVRLPMAGSLAGIDTDPDRAVAVFGFTSFTSPPALYRWEAGHPVEPWSALPGAPDPANYTVARVTYPSTDGTEIPMFLVRRADLPTVATPASAVLTGYGGFAVTMSPAWNPLAAAWCEDGGVWAVVCLRGGAEFGEDWHRAGMREHKQQVFDDFAAAAEWLVAKGITQPDRLAIRGGSNGGLLVAVTMTQRPDLCRAVHCAVPLTDMVRFPQFLIAKLWVPEYGDPEVADEFAWLHAYSPYHHVADGVCYPAALVTTAESDSRVDPNHARKFAARVQAATSCADEHPLLVRIETRAGHGQGKPVSKQADEAADVLSFLSWQLHPEFTARREN